MFDRISNSFALARSSWQVLRQDKQLLLFPIISGLACLLILITFWAPVLFGVGLDQLEKQGPPGWVYAVGLLYYFCTYFVVVFFNAALVSCALMRFHGETPTVADGLRAACMRLPQILAWSLVSASVGIILKAIENAHEKAGQIVSAILGTVWSVITYFVVPILVVEKVGPIEAIKRSTGILRKTWGEALVGNFGLGLFILLLSIPGILLFGLGIALVGAGNLLVPGILLIFAGVLYFLLISAVSTALHGIFLTALYDYAASGNIPQGFDGDSMRLAFKTK